MPARPKKPLAPKQAGAGERRGKNLSGLAKALRQSQLAAKAAANAAEDTSATQAASDPAIALLREAFRDVLPLPPANRATIQRPRPQRVARRPVADADRREVTPAGDEDPFSAADRRGGNWQDDSDAETRFAASGISRRSLLDLRRGRWPVEGQIDLHGLTRDEARAALYEFIDHCVGHGMRCVRVIHGRGLSSPGGVSILRSLSRDWLIRRPEVAAFCQARQQDGGAGALQVLLRTK